MKYSIWLLLLIIPFLGCGKLADKSEIVDLKQIREITLWTVIWEPYSPAKTAAPSESRFNPVLSNKPSRTEQEIIEQIDMYLNAKYRITTVERDQARGILAISMPREHGMYQTDIADVIVHVQNKEGVTLGVLKVFEEEDEARLQRKGFTFENLGDLTAYMVFEMMTTIGY